MELPLLNTINSINTFLFHAPSLTATRVRTNISFTPGQVEGSIKAHFKSCALTISQLPAEWNVISDTCKVGYKQFNSPKKNSKKTIPWHSSQAHIQLVLHHKVVAKLQGHERQKKVVSDHLPLETKNKKYDCDIHHGCIVKKTIFIYLSSMRAAK